MTHMAFEEEQNARGPAYIIAADEMRPSMTRQLADGLAGLLMVMMTGIIIFMLILWKSI